MKPVNLRKIARGAILFIFLGLIRTISEPMRQQYFAETVLQYAQVKPYLIAAEAAAIGLFLMTILSFYEQFRLVLLLGFLTLAAMLYVKFHYLL